MSINGAFLAASGPQVPEKKKQRRKETRAAPLSVRLSEAEKLRLARDAGGMPVGAYVKTRLFGEGVVKRRSRLSEADRRGIAQALALLGGSRLSVSLNEIAAAAAIGALVLTPDVEAELRGAIRAVPEIRAALLAALGVRPSDAGGTP